MLFTEELYSENESIESYGKLQGPGIKEFITKKTVIIGREPGEETEEEQKIKIGDSQKVSRQHIKIYWDTITEEWKVLSLSKNKSYINKTMLKKDDPPLVLTECSAIKFYKYNFDFFPAIN